MEETTPHWLAHTHTSSLGIYNNTFCRLPSAPETDIKTTAARGEKKVEFLTHNYNSKIDKLERDERKKKPSLMFSVRASRSFFLLWEHSQFHPAIRLVGVCASVRVHAASVSPRLQANPHVRFEPVVGKHIMT